MTKKIKFSVTKSGVKIIDDFRNNLIIDRYHPVFFNMRARKIKHMQSENSEDVVTWNVFHSLRQIKPEIWAPLLFSKAFPEKDTTEFEKYINSTIINLWKDVSPPPSLVESGDEGNSEIDICIESPNWVWFIEAKLNSDISKRTTIREDRDQIIRNIDVGSYYAGVRDFYFSLLIKSEKSSKIGAKKIHAYSDFSKVHDILADHRPDKLNNLKGISTIQWQHIGEIFQESNITDEIESSFAQRALQWMIEKKLMTK